MTKVLSQLLGAREPDFRLGVMKLESASGGQSHDIRLTSELLCSSRAKLTALGLDPSDTSGPELFQALNQKLAASDKELQKVLRLEPLEPSFLADFSSAVKKLSASNDCLALKASAAKRLFKANPPKKAMKTLGYRSLDSMLKHETLAGLYASTRICESHAWHKSFVDGYKKLTPSDFETRPLAITALASQRWQRLADSFTQDNKHNLVYAGEAGVLAVLPLTSYPSGSLTAMLLLSLAAANDVLATGSYLRLHQVRVDFGKLVASAASETPSVASPINGQQLHWRTVHEFLAGSDASFDPQLPISELGLKSPDNILANLSPQLEFWRGTGHLASLHEGSAVSLNPLDVALNYLNRLPFEQRVTQHFQQNLWHKFWQSYLQAEILGEKLVEGLRLELAGPELAPEFELSDSELFEVPSSQEQLA